MRFVPGAGMRGTRIVYAADRVAAVYLCKTHLSLNVLKMILYGGAGWLAGGIITDDQWDYRLATVGAIAGGLYGLASNRPGQRQIPIYRRAQNGSESGAVSP